MAPSLRIASFLPAATEMVYELGLGEYLVGVSHECDWPPEAKEKPRLVDCAIDMSGMTAAEIDKAVSEQLRAGKSIYLVDEEKLKATAPTLILTQHLCEVCGPSGNEVTQVLKVMKPAPEILWQTPKSFEQVMEAFMELGRKTGREDEAAEWVSRARGRVARIAETCGKRPAKTRVCFLEWVDPLYCGGHWIPKMLEWAGGQDVNCIDGADSTRMDWQKVLDWAPEVIIVAPCGYNLDRALQEAKQVICRPGFKGLPAAQSGRVFAVDANSYFARPGPRLVEGVELLAHLIDPQGSPWEGPRDAFAPVPLME